MSFKRIILFILIFTSCFLAADFVLAQGPDVGIDYARNLDLEGEGEDVRDVLVRIIQIALTFLGIIAVLIVMYGGWLWMTSDGDPSKVEKAKKTLISAIIGLLIILSAFMIVTFIINTGSGVLTPSSGYCTSDADCGGLVCCPGGVCKSSCFTIPVASDSFRITKFVPEDTSENNPRNTRVKVFFNRSILDSVSQSELNDNFVVRKIEEGLDTPPSTLVTPPIVVPRDGNIEISTNRRVLTFTAQGDCNDGFGTLNCFDPWSKFEVIINGSSAIVSDIGGLTGNTTAEFSTDNSIDTGDPTATLIPTQICYPDSTILADANTVRIFARDDVAISQIDFFYNSALSHSEPGNGKRYQNAEHQFVLSDIDPGLLGSSTIVGNAYTIDGEVYDLINHLGTDSYSGTVRESHCCNGLLDGGEAEIDCGGPDCDPCGGSPRINWVTPHGGFCRDANDIPLNTACSDDADCAGGICDFVTPNIADGNFVTISGKYFGNDPGEVRFFDKNGVDVVAPLANDATLGNASCGTDSDMWQDEQIIVVLPAGLTAYGTGTEVWVTRAGDLMVDTNGPDGNGPEFDIVYNNIQRPGLCSINPDSGVTGEVLNYEGVRLIVGSRAYFGGDISAIEALSPSFSGNSGTAGVASIQKGRTGTFVESPANIKSNYLDFVKLEDPYTGPYITSFNPASGAEKQYVTIYGSELGNPNPSRVGVDHHVYFDKDGDPETNDWSEADYNFPEVCADSIWKDNRIVIKVPTGLTDLHNYLFVIDINGIIISSKGAINDNGLPQETFFYDSNAPLLPGLCKLEPVMGPNNSDITLWGEYFKAWDDNGPGTSKVMFHDNKEQFGANIFSWGISGDAERIETTVHNEAISGPVAVVDTYNDMGNSLNFSIGSCSDAPNPDEACGTQICCPSGTIEEGRCKDSVDDCYGDLNSSVYEWGFDVGNTIDPFMACYISPLETPDCNPLFAGTLCPAGTFCDPTSCSCQPNPGESCAGFNLLECSSVEKCPNSPGQCSVGLYAPGPASCDCDDYFPGVGLVYSISENKCENTLATCSVDEDDMLGAIDLSSYDAYCAEVEGTYYWQMDPGLTGCPDANWVLNTLGDCTLVSAGGVGMSCSPCPDGPDDPNYVCVSDGVDNNEGTCMVNTAICSNSSTGCDASNKCIEPALPSNSCECCCEIGNGAKDCCSFEFPPGSGVFKSLTCEGDCGNDAVEVAAGNPDPNIYGYCTGCTIDENGDGFIDAGDQALSDEACNCSDSGGKYCETSAADGEGVCRDCAQLPISECGLHSATCCMDAENSDACRGGDGTILSGVDAGYCAYYNCADSGGCDLTASTTGTFMATSTCVAKCPTGGPSGGQSCYDEDNGNCGLLCSIPYFCFGEDGCEAGSCGDFDDTCLCCCDTAVDTSCNALGLGNLNCIENEPCSGGERGLCCGCSADSDCVPVGASPDDVGCGFDTCCRPRPEVVSTSPASDNTDVCRNALISAEFNEPMNVSSFSGNIILVGDYEYDTCPDNTQFLTLNNLNGEEKYKNIFVRIFYKFLNNIGILLRSILPSKLAAYFSPNFDRNYCAVSGASGGYSNADGRGVITFSPKALLDPEITYYAIIKGDDNLDGSAGVKNAYNIGMNAYSFSPAGAAATDKTFNGVYFKNAYIWSFETMDLYSANEGVCEIEYVKIDPESYLFQTNINDLNEVDNDSLDPNFDTVKDSDKVFKATAMAIGDIKLTPIPGVYDWTWVWTTDNSDIADNITPVANLEENKSLVRANSTAVDGKTKINATANIGTLPAGMAPGPFTGTSDVYVFLCDNPWPPVSLGGAIPAGNWEPWKDHDGNCTVIGGGCDNTNYEIYYCRDAGGDSTMDDLPAIVSDSTVIRGRSNFVCKGGYYSGNACTMGSANCDTPAAGTLSCGADKKCTGAGIGGKCFSDSDCQSPGVCEGVLKDAYFFREDTPDVSLVNLIVSDLTIGGSVGLSWNPVVAPPGEVLDSYVVYYGTRPGTYSDFINVQLSEGPPYNVDDLTNGVLYYFALTAKYVSGAESDYSNEVSATPSDSSSPLGPLSFLIVPEDGKITLSWDENSANTDVIGYEACYGMSNDCANKVDMDTDKTLEISSLNNGVEYWFGVSAYDADGNKSTPTNPDTLGTGIPFAKVYSPVAVASTTNNQVINLSWNLDINGVDNSGVSEVRIEYSKNSAFTPVESTITINDTSPDFGNKTYELNGLDPDTEYYFKFKTFSMDGIESDNNAIVSSKTVN